MAANSKMPQLCPRKGLQETHDTAMFVSEQVDVRWQRGKACQECHRRKTKCDMTTKNRCTHCIKLGIKCSVNEYRRHRKRERRSKIDRLETNIGRLEGVFESLGFNLNDKTSICPQQTTQMHALAEPDTSLVQSGVDSGWDAMSESDVEDSRPFIEPSSMSPDPTSNIIHIDYESDCQNNFFLGNLVFPHLPQCLVDTAKIGDADLYPLSEAARRWIGTRLGNKSLMEVAPLLSTEVSPNNPALDTPKGLFPRENFCDTPGKAETKMLFMTFLNNFNTICPIFDTMSLLTLCDDSPTYLSDDPGRWACANVVLALGHMLLVKRDSNTQIDDHYQKSWIFMKNALFVVNELCLGHSTLWTAQALLGMAIFLLGTLSNQPCSYLVTSALRISYDLATEIPDTPPLGWKEEMQQRRTVFWIAYCLDRDMCLRFGSPLAQNDEDINIDIPSWPSENLAYATSKEGNTGFSAFKSYCELSVIKGKVHKHLYSVTRTEKPTSEFNSSVIMLDRKLQKWKESLPKEYRPSVKTTPTFPKSLVSVILLNLHFSYFYCIMAVHRMVTLQNLDINIQLAKSYCYGSLPDDLAILSGSLCQDAARASIRLIKYIPNSNMSITGILLHYLIAASSFLSTSIIQNSRFASHAWDIMLITQVENFMSSLILDTPNEGMKRLVGHCATYRSLAEKAAQKNVKN